MVYRFPLGGGGGGGGGGVLRFPFSLFLRRRESISMLNQLCQTTQTRNVFQCHNIIIEFFAGPGPG